MGETVLLRCSLVLGEVRSCVVSKITTGPQSTKNLVVGGKPVLSFKMEQSCFSSKPGLPWEKHRSTAWLCIFCFSPWNYFAHQGQPQKERDSSLCWRLWKLYHISCATAQEQILLLSDGENRYATEQPLLPAMPCRLLCAGVVLWAEFSVQARVKHVLREFIIISGA